MPEADKEGERYQADQPQSAPGFFLKGSHQLDWGMKNRLARTFNPATGRTVMLAVDHGYFQGPTTGLERIDLSIVPLLPQCDALFCTRGILRSVIPAESQKPMVLRASGGPSILREELSDEQIAMDMDDAVRLNAAGVGIQVFIGGEHETRSVSFDDFIISERRYPNRIGQTYAIAYNPKHKWYWLPRQAREEALVFKVYDSAKDGRARWTAHTAFDDPTTPRNARPRESIEIRTLAFF